MALSWAGENRKERTTSPVGVHRLDRHGPLITEDADGCTREIIGHEMVQNWNDTEDERETGNAGMNSVAVERSQELIQLALTRQGETG